jgi:hypothetical protein
MEQKCKYNYTLFQKNKGKEKMVQWTTPFMIGITNSSLNSDDINSHHYQVFHITIPQSTFSTGKRPRFSNTSFGDLRVANYTIPVFYFH